MPRVTSVTDADCICVCAEIRAISSASSRDTLLDLRQRLARGVGELRPFDHADGRLLHGGHRVLRVRLNRLHDRLDLLRRLAGAFREPLHFLGDDGEAAARLAGGRRLDRGVQREHVRLLGDVRDQLDDLADLERRFAEALDALRRVLDLRADLVHAGDLVLHRPAPPFSAAASDCCATRADCAGGLRHLVDRLRHLQHRRRRLLDLPVLPLRRLVQPVRDRLRFLRRLRHLVGRRVDALDQRAQLLDREVDRVGDRAGHVLGHRRLHGQVAVGEVAHLVQQPEDRLLVALVLALALEGAHAGVVEEHLAEQHQHERARAARRRSPAHSVQRALPLAFVAVGELRRVARAAARPRC